MQDDNLKVDFAILTYHVKGLILSSLLIGDRLTPKVRNEWKLIYKRLITAAKNYEYELNKNLEGKSVDAVEDMDGIIFEIVHKIMRLEKEEYTSYMHHLNSWDDGKAKNNNGDVFSTKAAAEDHLRNTARVLCLDDLEDYIDSVSKWGLLNEIVKYRLK